ncbi:DUF819 family protein [Nocardiopsis xinjiangensis]|uniref:DUF819 family protein n=1 Tax=Nocardiopsis xinjiangensis TaxID=124285 RepID=UPI00034901E7|nr:DUF819 family protein [Nocardiopsis xinjiangensis]
MITDGFLYLGVLLALAGVLVLLVNRTNIRLFTYVPAFVLLYICAAALNTVGVFGESESIEATGGAVQDALLPAMILLLLFKCDLRKIIKLGPKLLLTFFVAAASIVAGFLIAFLVFRAALDSEAWKALGALSGSWTGGSANMVAVQGILEAPEDVFGYVLIVDTVLYSVWLLLMFSSVGLSDRFNRWTKADTTKFETQTGPQEEERPIDLVSLMGLIGFSLFASATASWIGEQLPELGDVVTATTWTILIVSVLGLIIATTPMGKTAGSTEIALVMLYVIIGIIASGSDFTSLTQAPIYLAIGIVVLIVHLAIMVVYAKLTRTELFSLAVASTANLGGVASAPVVAGAFDRQLVPVGVLYALMGSFLGTFIGLTVAQLLSAV